MDQYSFEAIINQARGLALKATTQAFKKDPGASPESLTKTLWTTSQY